MRYNLTILLFIVCISSCNILGGSLTDHIVIEDFSKEKIHKIDFEIDSSKHVYKSKICVKGDIQGSVQINALSSELFFGSINQCVKHEYYSNEYIFSVIPTDSLVVGKLKVSVTLYY